MPTRCPYCDARDVHPLFPASAWKGMARLWYRCDLCRRVWPDDGPAAPVSIDTDISPPAN